MTSPRTTLRPALRFLQAQSAALLVCLLDEFGFAEPTFGALDAAVDLFFGGDDRRVGLGEQGVERAPEEVFLDVGDVLPVRPWRP